MSDYVYLVNVVLITVALLVSIWAVNEALEGDHNVFVG